MNMASIIGFSLPYEKKNESNCPEKVQN